MNPNQCEVCKFKNEQCVSSCMFAPLFDSHDPYKFDVINTIFGLETLTFFLKDLSHMERISTTRTFYFVANACLSNPPNYRSDLLTALLNYANQTPEELSETKKLLASYTEPRVVLALPAPQMQWLNTDSSDESDRVEDFQSETDSSDESNISTVEDS